MSIDKIIENNRDTWARRFGVYKKFPEKVNSWLRIRVSQYHSRSKFTKNIHKFKFRQYIDYLNLFNQFLENNHNSDIERFAELEDTKRSEIFIAFINHLLEISRDSKIKGVRKFGETTILNTIQSRVMSYFSSINKRIEGYIDSNKYGSEKNFVLVDKKLNRKIHLCFRSKDYALLHLFLSQTGLRIDDILNKITNGNYFLNKFQERYHITTKKGEVEFMSSKRMVGLKKLFITKEIEQKLKLFFNLEDLRELDLQQLFLTRHGKRISEKNFNDTLNYFHNKLNLIKRESLSSNCFRRYMETSIRLYVKPKLDDWYLKLITFHYDKQIDHYNDLIKSDSWLYEQFLKWENAVMLFVRTDEAKINELEKQIKEKDVKIHNLELELLNK